MIAIGTYIKIQRTKQKMTLGELSEGIVSLSYLSKIENQKTEPNEDIIRRLCHRLCITIDQSQEEKIGELCKNWYEMLDENTKEKDMEAAYQEIQMLMDKNYSNHLIMFEIHKINYFLFIERIDLAANKITQLKEVVNTFSVEEQYYWYLFNGRYSFAVKNYYHSMYQYKRAEKITEDHRLEEKAEADLKYYISMAHSKLRNSLEAIEYAEEALEMYMKQYSFLHCARAHNILGICYTHIKLYEKAIKNFTLGLQLAETIHDKKVVQKIHQNLGYLYASKGDSTKAIEYYKGILNDSDVSANTKVEITASLVREYYHSNYYDEAEEYIDYGLSVFYDLKDKQPYLVYKYILRSYNYLLEEQFNLFEQLLVKDLLPLLKKQKDYVNFILYSELLAKRYEGNNNYKDAAQYYREVNQMYKHIAHI
ncbi:tetratricopeptide repeat protein [Oceanobacillus sp. M60]|uniref:helix-turn-helix domain-containing protein n=1 Tax=Oceanobacillus TaxID=182709 RepID=UPI0021165A8A|nr:helix-turn-helix transcriptional regulator [Oceanobacillus oncorhynchi]UUI41504.1 helix-turn-helix transcriptional regulator [Oceanobacillus oncorhynchi]